MNNIQELFGIQKIYFADCSIDFELGTDKNKKYFFNNKREDREFLIREANEGYNKKYADRKNDETNERFHRELFYHRKQEFRNLLPHQL